jgi:hypothetical protein
MGRKETVLVVLSAIGVLRLVKESLSIYFATVGRTNGETMCLTMLLNQ